MSKCVCGFFATAFVGLGGVDAEDSDMGGFVGVVGGDGEGVAVDDVSSGGASGARCGSDAGVLAGREEDRGEECRGPGAGSECLSDGWA